MDINMENLRGLLLFLVPTIIITVVLFIIESAGILLIIGFTILMIGCSLMYFVGLYISDKNKKIPYYLLVALLIISTVIAIVIFLIEPPGIITIIGLIVLFAAYSFVWNSSMKKIIQ